MIAELDRKGRDTADARAILVWQMWQMQALHVQDRDRLLEDLAR